MADTPSAVKVVLTTDEPDLQLPESNKQLFVPLGKPTLP